MRKLLCSLTILALISAAVGGFDANKHVIYKYLPKTTSGKPIPKGYIKFEGYDTHNAAKFKAQNHLSHAMNQEILEGGLAAKKASFINGTIDTIPYFSSWFITGNRNSVYPYSMAGRDPRAGGTTLIDNQIIPLVSVLTVGAVPLYIFDPTVAIDPQGAASVPSIAPGTDIGLLSESPLYNASTTYPGPPPQTGQIIDTAQRTEFAAVAAANWHTLLNTNFSSGIVWIQTVEWNNGDWACLSGSAPPCINGDFPVFNINTISANFESILTSENPPNHEVPIILTHWLTAFVPGGGCCVLGFHSAQAGIQDPTGILVWTWGTWIPYKADNGFTNPFVGGFGYNSMVLSHELSELYNDPFVNTSVAPWEDGSVSLAQADLEIGDVIEAMHPADVIYSVTLNTTGGIYSWPNEGTLRHHPHVPGACANGPTWAYGQGLGGFFFCNSNTGW